MSIFRKCITEELSNGVFTRVCGPTIWAFLLYLLVITYFIFWIWMIIDCANRKLKNPEDKTMWIILLILFPFPAAIIYFSGRKKR